MYLRIKFSTLLSVIVLVLLDMSCASNDDPKPADCTSLQVEVPAANLTPPTGCTSSDGSITAVASGGVQPYQYSIDGGTVFQASAEFKNLTAGTYSLTVKDANACITTVESVTLTNSATTLVVSETLAVSGGCKTNTGSISVTATGGQPPYQYSSNGTSFGSSSTLDGLSAGTYTITVKDAMGCLATKGSVKILSGVSFETQVKPILQTNCIKSGCHDGGTSLPNWSNLSTVQSNAANIKSKVLDGSMPKDGTLTQQQKDLIACWVDDGALDN
jgi:hypothetical protein